MLYQSCKVLHPGLQNLTSRGCKSLRLGVTNPYIHLVALAPPPKPGKSTLGTRLDDDGDDDDEDDGDEENDAGDNDDDDDGGDDDDGDDDDDKDEDELS